MLSFVFVVSGVHPYIRSFGPECCSKLQFTKCTVEYEKTTDKYGQKRTAFCERLRLFDKLMFREVRVPLDIRAIPEGCELFDDPVDHQ